MDPLEQFSIEVSIHSLSSIFCFFYSISLGKIIFINFFFIFFIFFGFHEIFILNKFQKITAMSFNYITTIIKDSLSIKKNSFILLFYTIFLFICFSNVLGMIPFSITVTSHLILTLFFSLSFFLGHNIIGICYHKELFFNIFLPAGVPIFIIPLLILIEYISYFSRIFSLAIRLFANMLSGHILLKILIAFIWSLSTASVFHWF
jgi:F-type H+-transporting ATPase subunit a